MSGGQGHTDVRDGRDASESLSAQGPQAALESQGAQGPQGASNPQSALESQGAQGMPARRDSGEPLGSVDPAGDYRGLGQPRDTVSGTTKDLFEVRGGSSSGGSSLAFKIIAIVAIVFLVAAVIVTQMGAH